jgi:hypothetical protein
MPVELQRELAWGIEQVKESSDMSDTLVEMASGLIGERNYRKLANDAIAEAPAVAPKSDDDDKAGIEEVKFSIAMWEGDFGFAYQTARGIAEQANSQELAGYRGWWWYLASVAAKLAGNNSGEIDALWHSQKSGVHIGFAAHLLSQRKAKKSGSPGFTVPINVERIWDTVTNWGWGGPAFDQKLGWMSHQSFIRGWNCWDAASVPCRCVPQPMAHLMLSGHLATSSPFVLRRRPRRKCQRRYSKKTSKKQSFTQIG